MTVIFYKKLMQTYAASCHCGAVKYEVDADIQSVIACNCSHCQRKGLLLTFVPESQFRLLSGEEAQTEYRFNKKVIQHLFCKTCGVQSFSRGKDEKGNPVIAVNVRCLEGVDPNTFTVVPFDGKSY